MARYMYTYKELTVIKLVPAVGTNVKKYLKIKEVGTKKHNYQQQHNYLRHKHYSSRKILPDRVFF